MFTTLLTSCHHLIVHAHKSQSVPYPLLVRLLLRWFNGLSGLSSNMYVSENPPFSVNKTTIATTICLCSFTS